MPTGTLSLSRFNGTERFAIETARMFTVGDADDIKLWFEIETVQDGAKQNEDTKPYPAAPKAELGIALGDFSADSLVGRDFYHVGPTSDNEDSCDSLFHYYEHQPLQNNHVVVSKRDRDTFKVRWSATTQDVNYYDGSKPDAIVEIDADFTYT